MEDTPMMAQGLRYNWAEDRPVVEVEPRTRSGKPIRACWRFWPHNPHLHMGPRGDEPMAACRGVRREPKDFTLAR